MVNTHKHTCCRQLTPHLLSEVDHQLPRTAPFPSPPNNPDRRQTDRAHAVCRLQKTSHRYGWKELGRPIHWHLHMLTPTGILVARGSDYVLYAHKRRTDGKASGCIYIPGGVPQQRRRSSTCSTSSPMNQDPRDTSSLAYLCRTCLKTYPTMVNNDALHLLYS
jgi:hypothetical protein